MKPSITYKDFRIEYHDKSPHGPHGFDSRSGLHVWEAQDGEHDDLREGIRRWNVEQASAPGVEIQLAVRRQSTKLTALQRGHKIEGMEAQKLYREKHGEHFIVFDCRVNSGDPSHFARTKTIERLLELLLFMTDVKYHSGRNDFWLPNEMEFHTGGVFEKIRVTKRISPERSKKS